jgi:hypothetical protein
MLKYGTSPSDAGEGGDHFRRVPVCGRGAAGLLGGRSAGGRSSRAHHRSLHRSPHGSPGQTLSYVIRDSYGFPVGDTLEGFGPPMRYLQTVCGASRHAGGARWFPDTITVTVPFNRPA